eukprot:2071749-Rhodomonas_salina.1
MSQRAERRVMSQRVMSQRAQRRPRPWPPASGAVCEAVEVRHHRLQHPLHPLHLPPRMPARA